MEGTTGEEGVGAGKNGVDGCNGPPQRSRFVKRNKK
ncbi:uncharacterized protein G2W53_041845 [Senna tora]|uniref:Uncharacterized protein n=1 Tax=Senna tora TaxID=362788 RepID=A0A834SFU6_9FABA|nr:uncharacterized protein G2W53_041845 [Senna tora]